MAKLHQFNALMEGKKAQEKKDYTKAYQLAGKPDIFAGQDRNYQPLADDGATLPSEPKLVQQTVSAVLDMFRKPMSDLLDAELTQDAANAEAKADLVVNGVTLAKAVPVTFLLRLEKQVVHIATLIRELPVLDPTYTWEFDSTRGVWVSQPIVTNKNDKVLKTLIEWAPPDSSYKQDPKVHTYTTDQPVGKWTTVKLSGAITSVRKKELEDKAVDLLAAVRSAREEANTITVKDQKVGAALFNWLLA